MFKKLMSAFVETDEPEKAAKPTAPTSSADVFAGLDAETQAMLASMDTGDTATEAPEVDDGEVEATTIGATPAPAPAPAGWVEGTTFTEIYTQAGVPKGPFTVEQFTDLRDKMTARQARRYSGQELVERVADVIVGVDAADSSWDVSDVMSDVANRTRALRGCIRELDNEVFTATQERTAVVAASQATSREAASIIEAQIAELRAELKSIQDEAQGQIDEADKILATKTAMVDREKARLNGEVERLAELNTYLQTVA
jgi:hypothetical protein